MCNACVHILDDLKLQLFSRMSHKATSVNGTNYSRQAVREVVRDACDEIGERHLKRELVQEVCEDIIDDEHNTFSTLISSLEDPRIRLSQLANLSCVQTLQVCEESEAHEIANSVYHSIDVQEGHDINNNTVTKSYSLNNSDRYDHVNIEL